MRFSRECEYALRGMVALATEAGGRPLMLSEIAERGGLPVSFLSKIFQKLLRHGLVQSHRGARRGYTLVRPASTITVRQTLEAIEGPDLFDRCLFSHRHCSEENSCAVHEVWRDVRPHVQAAFERTTLQDLVDSDGAVAALMAPRRGREKPPRSP